MQSDPESRNGSKVTFHRAFSCSMTYGSCDKARSGVFNHVDIAVRSVTAVGAGVMMEIDKE